MCRRAFALPCALVLACSPAPSPAEVALPSSRVVTASSCGQFGCASGLRIELGATKLPSGTYVIELEGDGQSSRCELSIPERINKGGTRPDCSGALAVHVLASESVLEVVGIDSILLPSAPNAVSARVRHDGALVGQLDERPTYATAAPNGPGCEPTCRVGELRLALANATPAVPVKEDEP